MDNGSQKYFVSEDLVKKLGLVTVAVFHTPRLRAINLQATWCALGGKSRVKAVTLFLTPPFRLNPNEAKGGRPYYITKSNYLV